MLFSDFMYIIYIYFYTGMAAVLEHVYICIFILSCKIGCSLYNMKLFYLAYCWFAIQFINIQFYCI